MSTGKCDVRGSPRIFKAAHMLFTNPSMEVNDAMKLAGYSKHDLTSRRIQKSISKKKCRLQQQSEVNGKKKGSKPVSILSQVQIGAVYQILPIRVKANKMVVAVVVQLLVLFRHQERHHQRRLHQFRVEQKSNHAKMHFQKSSLQKIRDVLPTK